MSTTTNQSAGTGTSSSDNPPVLGNSMPTETLDSGFQWSLDVVPSSGDQGPVRAPLSRETTYTRVPARRLIQ